MSEATLFALQRPIERRPAGTGPTAAIAVLKRRSFRRSLGRWRRGGRR